MGVDITSFAYLLSNKDSISGATLQLGRQGLHLDPPDLTDDGPAASLMRDHAPDASLADVLDGSGYTEALFRILGSSSVQSMDASNYENATIVHDLNVPVGAGMENRFDTIFDGGTIEHVYNAPTAYDSVRRMLRVGGTFIGIGPANNMLGHGFYQFSPEFFWRTFSDEFGFTVDEMCLAKVKHLDGFTALEDPQKLGRRDEIGATQGATYLIVRARKIRDDKASGTPQQSDYVRLWSAEGSH